MTQAIVHLDGQDHVNGAGIPDYFVWYREDGSIVFHLGALGDLPKDPDFLRPRELGPHSVTIVDDAGVVVRVYDLPGHWWNSSWRHLGAPLQVKNQPADIFARNRMFPYGDTGCKVGGVGNYIFKGPMDWAGITQYMGQTGERPDIGLVTDPSGFFLLTGNAGPMLAWAQGARSCPFRFRDESTGKPINLLKYPNANCADLIGLQGAPFLLKGLPGDPARPAWYRAWGGNWAPDQAHLCEMSYVAFQATWDVGFLEDLQYAANYVVLCDASHSNPTTGAVIVGQTRGIGWGLRTMFMAHISTKDYEDWCAANGQPFPDYLQPSSYWKKLLDQSLAYHTKTMQDPKRQTFRLVAEFGNFSPWTCDYLSTALPFGVLTGHADWEEFYLWTLGNPIARTNGTSGYPPGLGTSYRLATGPLKTVTNEFGTFYTTEVDETKPQFTWAEAVKELLNHPEVDLSPEKYDYIIKNPMNGGAAMMGKEYYRTTRATVVIADCLDRKGLAKVRLAYPELDTCIENAERMFRNYNAVDPKMSIIPVAGAGPIALPPPVPIGDAPPADPGQPAPPPVIKFDPVPAPPAGFHPKNPTPDDIYTGPTDRTIEDKKSRNIIGDGTTIITWDWANSDRPYLNFIEAGVPTGDGGFKFVEGHESGQALTLYGCAGLVIGNAPMVMPPPFQFPQDPANPPPDAPADPGPAQPPATGGTMTTITQGTAYTLKPKALKPPGVPIYGVKSGSWTIDKPEQAKLVPAADQQTATLTANVDTTAEDLKVSCMVFTDPAKTKTVLFAVVVSDILAEATEGTFDVTPVVG